jgi:hypothetical protein
MQFPELERITLNPKNMGGKPCIRGMRITVGRIVGLVASGAPFEEILQLNPIWNPRISGQRTLLGGPRSAIMSKDLFPLISGRHDVVDRTSNLNPRRS